MPNRDERGRFIPGGGAGGKGGGPFIKMEFDQDKIEATKKALLAFPKIVEEEFAAAINDVAAEIQTRARKKAPHFTTALAESINIEVKGWSERFIGTSLEYAPYVEFGTRPHGMPFNVPSLKAWCKDKGIPYEAMRLKIFARGTDPHPFMEPAFIFGKRFAEHKFNKAMSRACNRVQEMMAQ